MEEKKSCFSLVGCSGGVLCQVYLEIECSSFSGIGECALVFWDMS